MRDHDKVLALYTLLVCLFSSCHAQRSGGAALQAAASPLIWIMQPFEQCGGTGGLCNTKAIAGVQTCADQQYPGSRCPITYTCQRQTAAIWQCLPQQLQPTTHASGDFVPGSANGTVIRRRRHSGVPYQPAPIEDAGFRRFNISVWPNCAPWEYAVASRCIPAPNRTQEIMAQWMAQLEAEASNSTSDAGQSLVCAWQKVVLLLLMATWLGL